MNFWAFESYRLTDRHTDTIEIITTATLRVVINLHDSGTEFILKNLQLRLPYC